MDNYKKAHNAYYAAYKGINVKKNEKIVLECRTCWSYYFALDIPKADIKAHEQIILELKDSEYCYRFAKNIPGANIEEHFRVVFNSGDKDWLDWFIKQVNYKGTKVEEWIMYI